MSELVSIDVPREWAAALEAIISVADTFEVSAVKDNADFMAAEKEFSTKVAELEGSVLAGMLSCLDETAPRIEIDGTAYRKMNPANPTTYAGLRGAMRVTRHLYREVGNRNAPTIVPLELRAGIVEGRFTPQAAMGLAALNQAMPSREADELAGRLGVLPYSRSAMHRGGVAMGEHWRELEAVAHTELLSSLELPHNAHSVALSVDRVSMPMAEDRAVTAADVARGVKNPITVQFRMAFAACWTICDPHGKALMCVRYAHVAEGGARAMVDRLRQDLAVVHGRRPDLLLCTLADGAIDMQSLLAEVTHGYEVEARLVDFWHLAEYLGKAISSCGQDVAPLLSEMKTSLLEWDNGVEAVVARLNELQRAHGETEEVRAALRYMDNHPRWLGYAKAYRQGLPIGSGHVEATAKTIFETRMKRTGCRWRPDGGQALLGLRALATSSAARWDAAMKLLLATFRSEITRLPDPK